jgi:hypothetical protein
LLESLRSFDTNHSHFSEIIVDALSQARTTSGQQALAAIVNQADSFPRTVVLQAVTAIGRTPLAESQTLRDRLLSLMDSDDSGLSEAALLAYATAARNDTISKNVVTHRMVSSLHVDATPTSVTKALAALSCAGVDDANVGAMVAGLRHSPDELVREAAEEYLEGLPRIVTSDFD